MSTTIEMAIFEGQIEKELDTECKDFVASIVDEEKQSMDAEIEALNRNLDELSSQMKVEESSIIGKQRPVIAKGPHWIAIKTWVSLRQCTQNFDQFVNFPDAPFTFQVFSATINYCDRTL